MRFILSILIVGLLAGCASTTPPPPPEPKGDITPINAYHPVTGEAINND
jgi:hypothetical protein